MEKKMNKKEIASLLKEKINYNDDDCLTIINILEDNFLFLKKNKDKVIKDFSEILNIDELEAARIFDISSNLVTSIIKDKIKHPFRNQE